MSNETTQKELTAREIWNQIVKGKVVGIPYDPLLAKQLENHLNVIKSREKKIFLDLGLDFTSSVVSVKEFPMQIISDNCIAHGGFTIQLVAPKIRKKYPAFTIKTNEPITENGS